MVCYGHGVAKVRHNLATAQQQSTRYSQCEDSEYMELCLTPGHVLSELQIVMHVGISS